MLQTKTTEEVNRELKGYVVRFIDRQEKFKLEEAEYKKDCKEFNATVRDFMQQNGIPKFRFKSPHGTKYSVSDVRPCKVVWLIGRLKEKFPKNVFNRMVDKTYTVNDWDGFKDYMKCLGADPKLLISYFDVKEEVNTDKLDSLAESGEITKEDLSGCFVFEESEGYVRVTELE